MRGLPTQQLLQELALSPLGQVLSHAKANATPELATVESFYTRPIRVDLPERFLAGTAHFTQKH